MFFSLSLLFYCKFVLKNCIFLNDRTKKNGRLFRLPLCLIKFSFGFALYRVTPSPSNPSVLGFCIISKVLVTVP